jgi:hypothetical protein
VQERNRKITQTPAQYSAALPCIPEASVRITTKGQKTPVMRAVERHLKQSLFTEAIATALKARECAVKIEVDERIAGPEFEIKKQTLTIFLPKRVSNQDNTLRELSAFIIESAVVEVGLAAAYEAVEKGTVSQSAQKQLARFASAYPAPPKEHNLSTAEVFHYAVSSQAAELKKLRDGLVAKIQASGVFSPDRAFQVGAENAKRFAQIRAISELLYQQPAAVVGQMPLPAEVIVKVSYRFADALYHGNRELSTSMSNAYEVMAQMLSEGGYVKPFPAELKPCASRYASIHQAVDRYRQEGPLFVSPGPAPRNLRNPQLPPDITLHEATGLVKHLKNFTALPALVENLRGQDPSAVEGAHLLTEIIEHGLKLPRILSDIRAGKAEIDLEPLEAFYKTTLSLRFSPEEGVDQYFELVAYGGVPPPDSPEVALQQERERVLGYVDMLEVLLMLRSLPAERFVREIGAYEKDLCIKAMRGLRAGALAYENNLIWFLRAGGDEACTEALPLDDDSIALVEVDLKAFRDAAVELLPLMEEEHRQDFIREMTKAVNGIREGIAQLRLRRLSNDELVERLDELRASSSDPGLLGGCLQNASAELVQRIKAHAEATAAEAAQVLAEMVGAGRLQDLVEYSAKLLKLAALEPRSEASESLISAVVQYVGEIACLSRECLVIGLDRVKLKPGASEIRVADVRAALGALSSFRDEAQAMLRGLGDFEGLLPRHFLSEVRIGLEVEIRSLARRLADMPRLLGDVVLKISRDVESEEPEVRAGAAAAISGLRISRISAVSVPEWARSEFEKLVRRT